MDIQKDTTIFALRDGIKIYGEPVISEDWIIQRVQLKQNTYRAWVKADQIGKSTGQLITKNDVQFLEVECVACLWTRKTFLGNWKIANVMGYIPINALKSDVYFFQKDGTPISFPETNVPEALENGNKEGGDSTSYTTLLWVLVFILAMIAVYKAVKRKRKN
ncbi:hypothetical protein [Runella sp.]|uniref:hypothetical protein n=1 Tax=Runella sp. TaxID=1960881 RepID=UPI003D129863